MAALFEFFSFFFFFFFFFFFMSYCCDCIYFRPFNHGSLKGHPKIVHCPGLLNSRLMRSRYHGSRIYCCKQLSIKNEASLLSFQEKRNLFKAVKTITNVIISSPFRAWKAKGPSKHTTPHHSMPFFSVCGLC